MNSAMQSRPPYSVLVHGSNILHWERPGPSIYDPSHYTLGFHGGKLKWTWETGMQYLCGLNQDRWESNFSRQAIPLRFSFSLKPGSWKVCFLSISSFLSTMPKEFSKFWQCQNSTSLHQPLSHSSAPLTSLLWRFKVDSYSVSVDFNMIQVQSDEESWKQGSVTWDFQPNGMRSNSIGWATLLKRDERG